MNSRKEVGNLSLGAGNRNLRSYDGDVWEVVCIKSVSKAGNRAAGQLAQSNFTSNARFQPHTSHQKLGLRCANALPTFGNQGGRDWKGHGAGLPVNAPQHKHGWNRVARPGSSFSRVAFINLEEEDDEDDVYDDDAEEEDDDDEEEDDDDLLNDDDEDNAPKTHDSRKQHRMLRSFFEELDCMTVQEINDSSKQWQCPACQGGPGAIDWYNGLQPSMTHARTKGSGRVTLHQELAYLLDEKLRRRGISMFPARELFGHWQGLKEETKDHLIVWPPMVLIMNTLLDKGSNDKWLGMGAQELLDYFTGYAAITAKHAYGPKGHRGMSVLIFDKSPFGYNEAERLHKHFLSQGTGRNAWESNNRVLFYPGGKRQLYGFLARKDDLDTYNRHCQGSITSRVIYEMRSFQEMVVTKMRQMNEDNQQLTWLKNKVAVEQRHKKSLQESLNVVSQKLRQTMEENRIVRERTKMQHEQNKEEMDFQEDFFNSQIQKIHAATVLKENEFEMFLQKQHRFAESSTTQASSLGDHKPRAAEFLLIQEQEMQKFSVERVELMKLHEVKMMDMKKRYWEEELQLETELDEALSNLMAKYDPRRDAAAAGA